MSSARFQNSPTEGENGHQTNVLSGGSVRLEQSAMYNAANMQLNFGSPGSSPRALLFEHAIKNAPHYRDIAPIGLNEDNGEQLKLYIISRILDVKRKKNIIWLHGSESTGKSKMLADLEFELKGGGSIKGVGSFSFRSSDGKAAKIVSTLAYRLATNEEAVGQHIDQAIAKDRAIFDADFKTQWRELITEPVRRSPLSLPAVMMVDALDHCKEEWEQRAVLEAISTCGSNFPIAFLITTRPRSAIYDGVENTLAKLSHVSIDVDDWINIRPRVRSKFAELSTKRNPPNPEDAWPSDDIVNRITVTVNGQDDYIETFFKYLDQDSVTPEEHLADFLEHIPEGPSSLDELYTQIMRSLYKPNNSKFEDFLFLICSDALQGTAKSIGELRRILGPDYHECSQSLIKLRPVVNLSSTTTDKAILSDISTTTSFSAFLFDKHRNQKYFVDKKVCAARVMERCVVELRANALRHTPDRTFTFCWWKCSAYLQQPEDIPKSLVKQLQEIDFDSFLYRLSHAFLMDGFASYFDHYNKFGSTLQFWNQPLLISKYPQHAIEYATLARWLTIHYSCVLNGRTDCPIPYNYDALSSCEYSADAQRPLSWRTLLTLVRVLHEQSGIPEHDEFGFWSRGLQADDLVCASLAVFYESQWFGLPPDDSEHLMTWSRAWSQQAGSQAEGNQDEYERLKDNIVRLLRSLPKSYHYHPQNQTNVLAWLKRTKFSNEDYPTDLIAHWEAGDCSSPVTKDSLAPNESSLRVPESDSGVQVGMSSPELTNGTHSRSHSAGPISSLTEVEASSDSNENIRRPPGKELPSASDTSLNDSGRLMQPLRGNNQESTDETSRSKEITRFPSVP